MLTVGVETELWLWVERGSTSTEHTISARLVRGRNSTGIQDQTVKVDVSGAVSALTSKATGHVKQIFNLEIIGEKMPIR